MRSRHSAALTLTLATGIGGHYLNRRPDRALFFGVLLLAGTVFSVAARELAELVLKARD